jgi:hypothetical protein
MERMSEPKSRRKRQSTSTTPAKSTSRAKSPAPAKTIDFSEQERRDAAYYLWEQEGRPEGRALDHWLQVAAQRNASMTVR